jgi:hypothetical protein
MCSVATLLAAPVFFLLCQPSLNPYFLDPFQVVQNDDMMCPFIGLKVRDHFAGELGTKGTALGAMC